MDRHKLDTSCHAVSFPAVPAHNAIRLLRWLLVHSLPGKAYLSYVCVYSCEYVTSMISHKPTRFPVRAMFVPCQLLAHLDPIDPMSFLLNK